MIVPVAFYVSPYPLDGQNELYGPVTTGIRRTETVKMQDDDITSLTVPDDWITSIGAATHVIAGDPSAGFDGGRRVWKITSKSDEGSVSLLTLERDWFFERVNAGLTAIGIFERHNVRDKGISLNIYPTDSVDIVAVNKIPELNTGGTNTYYEVAIVTSEKSDGTDALTAHFTFVGFNSAGGALNLTFGGDPWANLIAVITNPGTVVGVPSDAVLGVYISTIGCTDGSASGTIVSSSELENNGYPSVVGPSGRIYRDVPIGNSLTMNSGTLTGLTVVPDVQSCFGDQEIVNSYGVVVATIPGGSRPSWTWRCGLDATGYNVSVQENDGDQRSDWSEGIVPWLGSPYQNYAERFMAIDRREVAVGTRDMAISGAFNVVDSLLSFDLGGAVAGTANTVLEANSVKRAQENKEKYAAATAPTVTTGTFQAYIAATMYPAPAGQPGLRRKVPKGMTATEMQSLVDRYRADMGFPAQGRKSYTLTDNQYVRGSLTSFIGSGGDEGIEGDSGGQAAVLALFQRGVRPRLVS